jgi:glycerophosphoryl diester phosphodiesterase
MAGARIFEVDVQVDGDDRIVVSHYFPVGRSGLLQRYNWRVRWHTSARRDPRLDELDAHVPAGCHILLDLKEKTPDRRARLRDALIDALPHRERFHACGPHEDDLAQLRTAGFRTWRTVRTPREIQAVLDAEKLPDDAVTIRHTLVTPTLLDRLHQIVPSVVVWTVNNVGRAEQLQAMGVDGVTTDRVAIMHALSRPTN